MKQFLKENPTLAFGLGLPVLLVIVFVVGAGLPNLFATPPKYDVVFATNYYDNPAEGFRIHVTNGKATVNFTGNSYCNTPQLYRYNVAAGSVKRIDIQVPQGVCSSNYNADAQKDKSRVVAISVPELEALKLDDSNPAPDGYQFSQGDGYYNSGILPSLFFSRSYSYNEPVLRKGSYRVRMPLENNSYGYYNTHFIGWVVAP
jgi:hypothetical protein